MDKYVMAGNIPVHSTFLLSNVGIHLQSTQISPDHIYPMQYVRSSQMVRRLFRDSLHTARAQLASPTPCCALTPLSLSQSHGISCFGKVINSRTGCHQSWAASGQSKAVQDYRWPDHEIRWLIQLALSCPEQSATISGLSESSLNNIQTVQWLF